MMKLNETVENIQESLTLKINEQISSLKDMGKRVVNLTSGQLNFRPPISFTKDIEKQLNFLKSFQYSPNAGMRELRVKFLEHYQNMREMSFSKTILDCVISNGAKQSLFLSLKSILNPGDEVIVFAPYWGSYLEMLKLCEVKIIKINSLSYNKFQPDLELFKKSVSDKTKLVIINSPNNPTGIHYTSHWMEEFARFAKEQNFFILSDEIYSEINYFDPAPSYFYQYDKDLLSRTIIINGISKNMASTGLRVGYCIASKEVIHNMTKLQSQLSSGPNSLIQRALLEFDFSELKEFHEPIAISIRKCAQALRDCLVKYGKAHCWYQSSSSFYYLIDFTKFDLFEKNYDSKEDYSEEICEKILQDIGVALVPGSFFGADNCARISLTIEEEAFKEAIESLVHYLEGSRSA